jgi:hypothetical protein
VSPEDSFDDEVPVPDAVDQHRPAAEAADTETLDPAERVPVEDGPAPLESDAADWQEQHTDVETDPDEDFR